MSLVYKIAIKNDLLGVIMKCYNCGTEVADNIAICPSCGENFLKKRFYNDYETPYTNETELVKAIRDGIISLSFMRVNAMNIAKNYYKWVSLVPIVYAALVILLDIFLCMLFHNYYALIVIPIIIWMSLSRLKMTVPLLMVTILSLILNAPIAITISCCCMLITRLLYSMWMQFCYHQASKYLIENFDDFYICWYNHEVALKAKNNFFIHHEKNKEDNVPENISKEKNRKFVEVPSTGRRFFDYDRFYLKDWESITIDNDKIGKELEKYLLNNSIEYVYIVSPALNYLNEKIEKNTEVPRSIEVSTPIILYIDNEVQLEIMFTNKYAFKFAIENITPSLAEWNIDRNIVEPNAIFEPIIGNKVNCIEYRVEEDSDALKTIIIWTVSKYGLKLEKSNITTKLTLIDSNYNEVSIPLNDLEDNLCNKEKTHYAGSNNLWYGRLSEKIIEDTWEICISTDDPDVSLYIRSQNSAFMMLLFYAFKEIKLKFRNTVEIKFEYEEWLKLLDLGEEMAHAKNFNDFYWSWYDYADASGTTKYQYYLEEYGKALWENINESKIDMKALKKWTAENLKSQTTVVIKSN